ncbi:DUF2634 domain-containing protein [Lacticaseibacillus saniviri]|uniref:Phage protein n=2 Tax=Lacticaseibacillus saniviri TaxID=931533 RepID=A0A0R2MSQ8_9LACO|nr:DUF2634 domain-containing protein [Lacticaseibacillus saniviri]KRO16623.1 hypothetical protein IV56_GL001067 [Lacticaseibacillus saniviri JCM 17471 = DSM 24301]
MDDYVLTDTSPETAEVTEVTMPSLTYQVIDGHVRHVGTLDGQDAMRQAVEKILRTERFVWPIYSDQYGNDLMELVGKEMPYARAEVGRMLSEALLADDRVDQVIVNDITAVESSVMAVKATVYTQFGKLNIESEVTT